MKKLSPTAAMNNPFDFFTDEIIHAVLDHLDDDPFTRKSFSLVCKSFYLLERLHRKSLKPLRSELLHRVLHRYPSISHLDLSCCPRVNDPLLASLSASWKSTLRSINLSRSRHFTATGLRRLTESCSFLVEIDLSNGTELTDAAAEAVAEAKNLERLMLARCKLITDIGIGCVAVGCRKLRLLCLRWCIRVTDLGVGFIAMKCKELRSLDLSCLPCLRLRILEIRGCPRVSTVGLSTIARACRELEVLDIKKCIDINDNAMFALGQFCQNLRQINLSYCSVTDAGLLSLANTNRLQNITILHLAGLTQNGLAAALLACGGLTKVKLHTPFKPLLPKYIFEHMEGRGCAFHWRDKAFQVEIDPNGWQLHVGKTP